MTDTPKRKRPTAAERRQAREEQHERDQATLKRSHARNLRSLLIDEGHLPRPEPAGYTGRFTHMDGGSLDIGYFNAQPSIQNALTGQATLLAEALEANARLTTQLNEERSRSATLAQERHRARQAITRYLEAKDDDPDEVRARRANDPVKQVLFELLREGLRTNAERAETDR